MIKEEKMYDQEQPLSPEDKELVNDIYARLDIFEEKCRPYHEAAKESRLIMHMEDPKQEMNPRAKKKTLQLQTLKSTINNVVADQLENMPDAKLLPETPDKQAVSEDLQDLVHYVIYTLNNYDMLHSRLAEDFYVTGSAVTQIAWDPDMGYGKGDIGLIRWPLEAFLWDPVAENLQDSRAVMKVSWHPLSWFRDHYPEAGEYVCADENNHNNVGMVAAQEDADHAADEDRALLVEYWYRTYSDHKYHINVAYVAGGALLEHQKDVYAHGEYPFVIMVHDYIEGAMVGEGLVHELAPMMRYINRYASYIDMNLRMSSKGRVLMRKGCGIDKESFADMDQDIVEGDRIIQGEDWNWIQNAPFNNMISQQILQFQTELKQDSGANQFTRGEVTGGIVSGKAIGALQDAGGKVSRMRTSQIKSAFKQIVEQILWLMSEFYDDKRIALVTGRSGVMRSVQFRSKDFFGSKGKGAIDPPPYTVQIEIQTRNPDRIDQQNQMYMEAYTMAAQAQQFFPLSSLFQLLNVDGKDRLLPVIEGNEAYQQQMQQMQQQMEQMGMQMEQLQKENQNLKSTASQMTNALAGINAQSGGGFLPNNGQIMPEGNTEAQQVADARGQLEEAAMM